MIKFLLKILRAKTISFAKALQNGDCAREVKIFKTQNLLICGNGIFEYGNESELKLLIEMGGALAKNSPNNSQNLPKKSYSNFHLKDIFGFHHRFFRPFSYRFKECAVHEFDSAYFYSNSSEVLITKHKKALISNTSYFHHEFEMPTMTNGFARTLLWCVRQAIKWVRFYCTRAKFIDGNVAILHQSTNYYHFLCESMASLLQIRAFEAKTGVKIDFYTMDSASAFQSQMWEILRIPPHKILPPNPKRLYKARRIFLPTHIANVEYVEYRDRITWSRAFALPTFLRNFYDEFALKYLGLDKKHPFRKIFLTRPKNSNRNIVNLAEVEAIFQNFGYEIILPDALSLAQQVSLMNECKVVASNHGAGLANALFMQRGACVFEIFSEFYFDPGAQIIALLKQMRYFYMVGQTKDTSPHPQKERVYVAPKKLNSALKEIEQYL